MLDTEVRERVARVEGLVEEVADDPAAFAALQAIVALYGEALRRIADAGSEGEANTAVTDCASAKMPRIAARNVDALVAST